jgi:hypothetical protein
MSDENKRKRRNISYLATDKQKKFAELIVQGHSQIDAARIAYPNATDPASVGCRTMQSRAVKHLITAYSMDKVKLDAMAVPFRVLMDICKNPDAKDSDRIKAALGLKKEYGTPPTKGNGGDGSLEDMTDEELTAFLKENADGVNLLELDPDNLADSDIDSQSTTE